MYPITSITILFLVYAVADCVLPTCPGLKRLLILCIRRPFFPSMTFFKAISARSCAPFQFFTLQDLVRGECDVWFFYEHDLAFVPFSFFHPLHVGEQSVEYPQGVISIQRTKASGLGPRVPFYLNAELCALCFFLLLVLWVAYALARSAPTNSFKHL